jgi:hypothetical protein
MGLVLASDLRGSLKRTQFLNNSAVTRRSLLHKLYNELSYNQKKKLDSTAEIRPLSLFTALHHTIPHKGDLKHIKYLKAPYQQLLIFQAHNM